MTESRAVSPPGTLQVLAGQIEIPKFTDAASRDRHLRRVVTLVGAALERRRADLVVLPELSSVPYDEHLGAALPVLAEPLEGPSFAAFAALAERFGVNVLFGFPRRADDGYRICQALVGTSGTLLGHYDKIHLAN